MKRRKWFQRIDAKTGVITFTLAQWDYLCLLFEIKSKSRAVQKRMISRHFNKMVRLMLREVE